MKPEYYIRPFRMSDLDAVLLIERASFGADAYDRNLFAELFREMRALFLVAAARTGISAYMVTSTALGRATPSPSWFRGGWPGVPRPGHWPPP